MRTTYLGDLEVSRIGLGAMGMSGSCVLAGLARSLARMARQVSRPAATTADAAGTAGG